MDPPPHSLHWLLILEWGQIELPWHSLHVFLIRLCGQIETPPHSLHVFLIRLCGQTEPPPHSLHWLFCRLCSQRVLCLEARFFLMLASVSLMANAIVSGADAAGIAGFGFTVAAMPTGPGLGSGPGPGRWMVVVEGTTEGPMGVELDATIAISCESSIVTSFTVEGVTITGGTVGVELLAVAVAAFRTSGVLASFTAALSTVIAGVLLGVGAAAGSALAVTGVEFMMDGESPAQTRWGKSGKRKTGLPQRSRPSERTRPPS